MAGTDVIYFVKCVRIIGTGQSITFPDDLCKSTERIPVSVDERFFSINVEKDRIEQNIFISSYH